MRLESFMPTRFYFFAGCVLAFVASAAASYWHPWLLPVTVVMAGLSLLGTWDMLQTRQAIRRNYPILAHLRFFLEFIRPEIRQYFLESENEKIPFSRAQRSLVYQRAKNVIDKRPYGTLIDLYEEHYEWINHSMNPVKISDTNFRVQMGEHNCKQPYSHSVFSISAMSFGALSAAAVRALNIGAKKGGFAHDTGEGGISQYHRENGGDLIWEVGSGYFGCRNPDGSFNAEKFAQEAQTPQVKMIELKISQGAKPGHGGVLPGPKVTAEIAHARGVAEGVDCISPARHPAFSTPIGMLEFIARLRELSGGKPTGFKL
ncbi:MAG: glutamate synthase-related protein, partial [Nevskiales bacterium]